MNATVRMAIAIICALVGSFAWVFVYLSKDIPTEIKLTVIDVLSWFIMAFFVWFIVEAIVMHKRK